MNPAEDYPRLCVVTAVDLEFNAAAGLLRDQLRDSRTCRGTAGKRQVTVVRAGIGAGGIAPLLEELLTREPYDGLIVAGLAGALDPSLCAGATVLYDQCLDASFFSLSTKKIARDRDEIASIFSDHTLTGFCQAACLRAGVQALRGSGVMTARFIAETAEKQALARESGAQAVDMETLTIWRACVPFGIPFTALRIISDDARAEIPDFNRAYRSDGSLVPAQMALAMGARPIASARFLLNVRSAVEALRKGLQAQFNA